MEQYTGHTHFTTYDCFGLCASIFSIYDLARITSNNRGLSSVSISFNLTPLLFAIFGDSAAPLQTNSISFFLLLERRWHDEGVPDEVERGWMTLISLEFYSG
jgi:hypothetical protein